MSPAPFRPAFIQLSVEWTFVWGYDSAVLAAAGAMLGLRRCRQVVQVGVDSSGRAHPRLSRSKTVSMEYRSPRLEDSLRRGTRDCSGAFCTSAYSSGSPFRDVTRTPWCCRCSKTTSYSRLRKKPKNAKGQPAGSIAWLYSDGEQFESSHGRQPGTMKALALAREKQAKKS